MCKTKSCVIILLLGIFSLTAYSQSSGESNTKKQSLESLELEFKKSTSNFIMVRTLTSSENRFIAMLEESEFIQMYGVQQHKGNSTFSIITTTEANGKAYIESLLNEAGISSNFRISNQ